MNATEASFSVNVDAANPAQFFACCGLLELAARAWPGAEGCFHHGVFSVFAPAASENALAELVQRLASSPLHADDLRGDSATRPVTLAAFDITLDWWIRPRGAKTPLKLWAGQQSALTIAETLRLALAEMNSIDGARVFDQAQALTGRFGLDPRSAWNALDVGFSPNDQGMQVATFPAVELLAAVGLQRFPPVQAAQGEWHYSLWNVPLSPAVARAAAAGSVPSIFVEARAFRIIRRSGSYKGFDFAHPL